MLLLYGAGLRISEALALTLADVDLSASLLTIHESKFYKTRLVPIGPRLMATLRAYADERRRQGHSNHLAGPFFVTRTGTAVTRGMAEQAFVRLRTIAGIAREDGARYQPRLHDLRHTMAVHRLVAWYREGARCTTAVAAAGNLPGSCRCRGHPALSDDDTGTAL